MTDVCDITIAICTRNSATRIAAVLNALAVQNGVLASWEIVLVDNASTDGTGPKALEIGQKLHLPLRVVVETKLGLSNARKCAVREARGQLLGFVDDDNILEENWVHHAVTFMANHPRAGLVGGRIIAGFDDPQSKPLDFEKRYAEHLGCWDLGDQDKQYAEPVWYPPCGAGLLTRTHLLRGIFEQCGCHLTGRSGGRLISGEDYEMGLLILKLGWEAWYTPGLQMQHMMAPFRLTEDYLRRIKLGNVQSEHWLNYLRNTEPQRSRWSYLREYLGWRRRAFGGDAMTREKKEEYILRAEGAWRLAWSYPFTKVQRGLATLKCDSAMSPAVEK